MIGRLFLSHSLDGTVGIVSNFVSTLVVAVFLHPVGVVWWAWLFMVFDSVQELLFF